MATEVVFWLIQVFSTSLRSIDVKIEKHNFFPLSFEIAKNELSLKFWANFGPIFWPI